MYDAIRQNTNVPSRVAQGTGPQNSRGVRRAAARGDQVIGIPSFQREIRHPARKLPTAKRDQRNNTGFATESKSRVTLAQALQTSLIFWKS